MPYEDPEVQKAAQQRHYQEHKDQYRARVQARRKKLRDAIDTQHESDSEMARKYEISLGKYAWNPEQCEEILLIAGFDEIARFKTPAEQWIAREFEYNFYQKGVGISAHIIAGINDIRKRKNLKPVEFQETDIGPYGRETDRALRAQQRQDLRDMIAELDNKGLARIIEDAQRKTAELPSPHFTWEEWKGRNNAIEEANRENRAEIARRVLVAANETDKLNPVPEPEKVHNKLDQQAGQTGDEAAKLGRIDKVRKMLNLAEDPNLHIQIIKVLDGEEALQLAGEIDAGDLRNALVAHCLAGMTAA